MKTTWIPIILTAAVAVASGAEKRDPDVIVFVHSASLAPRSIPLAEGQAKRMLANVGIAVEFRLGKPHYHGSAETIEAVLTTDRDENFTPGALAFATLGQESGTRIEIFYNRIRGSHRDATVTALLAHVLVHEITHILEGVNRHSENGVMKAYFGPEDRERMSIAPLPFAAEDIRLLHAWSERHHQTLLAVGR